MRFDQYDRLTSTRIKDSLFFFEGKNKRFSYALISETLNLLYLGEILPMHTFQFSFLVRWCGCFEAFYAGVCSHGKG